MDLTLTTNSGTIGLRGMVSIVFLFTDATSLGKGLTHSRSSPHVKVMRPNFIIGSRVWTDKTTEASVRPSWLISC